MSKQLEPSDFEKLELAALEHPLNQPRGLDRVDTVFGIRLEVLSRGQLLRAIDLITEANQKTDNHDMRMP